MRRMKLEAIRRKVGKHTVPVAAAMTKIPRRTLYRFVHGMTPRYETMMRLEAWAKSVR